MPQVRWISYLQHILDKVAGKVAVQDAELQRATAHYREGNKYLLDGADLQAIKVPHAQLFDAAAQRLPLM